MISFLRMFLQIKLFVRIHQWRAHLFLPLAALVELPEVMAETSAASSVAPTSAPSASAEYDMSM